MDHWDDRCGASPPDASEHEPSRQSDASDEPGLSAWDAMATIMVIIPSESQKKWMGGLIPQSKSLRCVSPCLCFVVWTRWVLSVEQIQTER